MHTNGRTQGGGANAGASLVAMINPNSPVGGTLGAKHHLGSSLMTGNVMISQQKGTNDLSTTLPLGKKNGQYVRGVGQAGAKKELSGIGLMMSDHGQPIRQHQIGDLIDNKTGNVRNSRIGLDHNSRDKNYVSHSPQPYSKFKLQPTKNSLMIYGQNGQNGKPENPMYNLNGAGGGISKEGADSRTLNAPQNMMSGRNANGYPISSFDKNNALSKNSSKNIERYQKGSFVQNTGARRTKAHSNNATGGGQQALKVNQSGIMIGLPKVNKPGDDRDRGAEFSPAMAKSGQGYSMLNSHNNMNGLKMPSLVDRSHMAGGEAPGALPSLQRHQQQAYNGDRSEFRQAYENHIIGSSGKGFNGGSNENGQDSRGRRSHNNNPNRDKDSRSHSHILPASNLANGRQANNNVMPSYADLAAKAQQHQKQMYKSNERKHPHHNEAASPASVSLPHANVSGTNKAGHPSQNVYGNMSQQQNYEKKQRGSNSRNGGRGNNSSDIFQQHHDSRNLGEQQSHSTSPPLRNNNLIKINPGGTQTLQHGTNFTGINIRRQGPTQNPKSSPKKEKNGQLANGGGPQVFVPEIVEQIGVKSRTGFIPQMRKVNQDSYCIQRELASIPGLWMFGVMDGHGVNGHQASNFCKSAIPTILTYLMGGASTNDIVFQNNKIVNRKQRTNGKKDAVGLNSSGFLPNITGRAAAQRSNSNDAAGTTIGTGTTKDADTWLSTEIKQRDRQICESFELCQDKLDGDSKIDVMFSGTTSVYCFLSNNHLVCANSGDSRAMLCSLVNGKWQATQLSRDHKPEEPDEAARVKRSNGRIEQSRLQPGMTMPGLRTQAGMFYGPKRVWLKNKQVPGLAMTRSIGDMAATSVGVTAKPEITYFPNLSANDKILVMGSDGLWDRFSNHEIMMIIVNGYYSNRDAEGAIAFLMKESVDRWTREQGMVDDITISVAYLNVGQRVPQSSQSVDQ